MSENKLGETRDRVPPVRGFLSPRRGPAYVTVCFFARRLSKQTVRVYVSSSDRRSFSLMYSPFTASIIIVELVYPLFSGQ